MKHKPARSTFRWIFYPLVVGGTAFAYLLLARGRAPEELPLVTAGVVLSVLALTLLLERVIPYRSEWNLNRGDLATDFVQSILVLPAVARLNEALAIGGVLWLSSLDRWQPVWPSEIPFPAQLVLAAMIAEFGYYWVHRLSHRVPMLWRLHAVHHGSTRVYSMNSGRFHLLDAWLGTAVYLAPLHFLGVPLEVMALLATLSATTGLLEHVNIDFAAGPLNRVFNTAELHRWHHRTDIEQAMCNFGKMFSIWDSVFGTYYLPREREVGDVGIGATAKPVPVGFWGQLLYPFCAPFRALD